MSNFNSPSTMSAMFYYAMDNRHATNCAIRMELDHDIDYDIMNSSIQKSMKRFPYLCQKLVVKDGQIYTEYNDTPVILHDEPIDVVINAQRNDNHLLRFSYCQSTLTLQVFHGLTDASCMLRCLKMILVDYYISMGETDLVLPSDLLDYNNISPEETADPFDYNNPNKPLGITGNKHFYVCKDKATGNDNAYMFSCCAKKFMEYVKSTGATPNAAAAVMLAKAFREVDPRSRNKTIDIGIAVNAKPIIGIPKSHIPCITCSISRFNDEVFSRSIESIHADVRRKIKDYANPNTIGGEINKINFLKKVFNDIQGLDGKRLLGQIATASPRTSASVSYVGKTDFGGLEKHILSIYSTAEAISPLIEINCTSDKFFFCLNTKFDGLPYMKAFHSMCSELGLNCSEIKTLHLSYDNCMVERPKVGLNKSTFQMIAGLVKSIVKKITAREESTLLRVQNDLLPQYH